MLLICILIASPVSLTIPEGNWLSSEYSLVEEWSLSPLEYVSTVRVPIGCITESEEGSEYTWDITLLDENRVIRFEDDQQIDQLEFDITVCQQFDIVFSPSGNYLLLFDDRNANCLRIYLDEMHSEHADLLDNHMPGSTYLSITDNGSIVVAIGLLRRVLDGSLTLVYEDSGYGQFDGLTHDNEGNRYFFSKFKQLIAVSGSGEDIWGTEISLYTDLHDIIRDFITDSFGRTVVVRKDSFIQLFSGATGSPFYSESFDYLIANPIFSPSGNYLAIETITHDEMLNAANGIRVFSISSPATGAMESFHSIYTNRESPRFYPISVSDSGMVLAQLSYWGAQRYRLVLLDSSGNAVWISAFFSYDSGYFAHSCGGLAGMTPNGNNIWHFDGNLLHSYKLERG